MGVECWFGGDILPFVLVVVNNPQSRYCCFSRGVGSDIVFKTILVVCVGRFGAGRVSSAVLEHPFPRSSLGVPT